MWRNRDIFWLKPWMSTWLQRKSFFYFLWTFVFHKVNLRSPRNFV
jgi:hypothetical protein